MRGALPAARDDVAREPIGPLEGHLPTAAELAHRDEQMRVVRPLDSQA